MSEEIVDRALAEARPDDRPNPHLLAYDFFKHMTTLTVLTLGGVLTLSSSIFEGQVAREPMLLSIGLIAASGLMAFGGQIELVDWAHRGTARPRAAARWGRGLVAMTFGAGVGAFLSVAV